MRARISVQRPITCVNTVTVVVDLCFLSVFQVRRERCIIILQIIILHVQAVLVLSIRSDALLVVYYQASGCNHGTILYDYCIPGFKCVALRLLMVSFCIDGKWKIRKSEHAQFTNRALYSVIRKCLTMHNGRYAKVSMLNSQIGLCTVLFASV